MTTTDVSIPSSASVDDTSIELDGTGKISIKDAGVETAHLKDANVTAAKLHAPHLHLVEEKNVTSGVASVDFTSLSGSHYKLVFDGDCTNDTYVFIRPNDISNANFNNQTLKHTDTSAAAESLFNQTSFLLLDTIAATSRIIGEVDIFVNEDDDLVNILSRAMARSNYGMHGKGWNDTDSVTSITKLTFGVVAGTFTGNLKLFRVDS